MATEFVDIERNKKVDQYSPIAVLVFVAIFIVLTIVMRPSIMYLLFLVIDYVFVNLFFDYEPRFVFMTIMAMFKHQYLVPNFKDKEYLPTIDQLPSIKKILPDYERNMDLEDDE